MAAMFVSRNRQDVLAEDLAGMDRGRLNRTPHEAFLRHDTYLVILLQVHADRLAVLPLEGHAPGTVHVEAVSDRSSFPSGRTQGSKINWQTGSELEWHRRTPISMRTTRSATCKALPSFQRTNSKSLLS